MRRRERRGKTDTERYADNGGRALWWGIIGLWALVYLGLWLLRPTL